MVYVNVLCMVYVRGEVKTSGVVECRTGSEWILYKDELFGDIESEAYGSDVLSSACSA